MAFQTLVKQEWPLKLRRTFKGGEIGAFKKELSTVAIVLWPGNKTSVSGVYQIVTYYFMYLILKENNF